GAPSLALAGAQAGDSGVDARRGRQVDCDYIHKLRERVVVTAHPGAEGGERPWVARRQLYSGFGEALAQAFEFAATPILFAALGWWLDSLRGTGPILLVVLSAFGFTGVCLRAMYHYKARVEKEEEGKPWTRRPR